MEQAGAELGQAQPELGLEDRVLCCGLNYEAEAWSSSWSSKLTIRVEVLSRIWSFKVKLKIKVDV